jgi:hypothetical protein
MASGPRQHIIPSFHLSQFTGNHPKDCVWVYDGKDNKTWPSSPDGIGHETYAYSVREMDGSWNTTVDEWVTKLEGFGVPVYRKLLELQIPHDHSEDRAKFAAYMAFMHTRTKAMRRLAAEAYAGILAMKNELSGRNEDVFATLVAEVEEREGRPLSPEDREAYRQALLDPSKFSLTIPKGKALIGMTAVPEIAKLFEAMSWTLCIAEGGFFITSDNPVAIQRDPKSPFHLGFMNKSVEVMLPLSPKFMLMLTWRKNFRKLAALPAVAVTQVNQLVANYAERFLYSHLEHKHVAKLAREAYKVSRQMDVYSRAPKFASVKIKR